MISEPAENLLTIWRRINGDAEVGVAVIVEDTIKGGDIVVFRYGGGGFEIKPIYPSGELGKFERVHPSWGLAARWRYVGSWKTQPVSSEEHDGDVTNAGRSCDARGVRFDTGVPH